MSTNISHYSFYVVGITTKDLKTLSGDKSPIMALGGEKKPQRKTS